MVAIVSTTKESVDKRISSIYYVLKRKTYKVCIKIETFRFWFTRLVYSVY